MKNGKPHPARVNEDIDKIVGENVRRERLAQGMSQEKLAEALGVTFQQVQKYEKGANRIAVSTLFRMAQAFKVQPDIFFRLVAEDIRNEAA